MFASVDTISNASEYSRLVKSAFNYMLLEPEATYSTEIFELVSKLFDLKEFHFNNRWFDSNFKLISYLINFIDSTDSFELLINLLEYSKFMTAGSDRISALLNLFNRMIDNLLADIDISQQNSVIFTLFKHQWFILLIQKDRLDERDSGFRQDLFLCLMQALQVSKDNLLRTQRTSEMLKVVRMSLDIIDVCYKIIEWSDNGEAHKMYFLILSETCFFFDDPYFMLIYNDIEDFVNLKNRLEHVLIDIATRITAKPWNELPFPNESSKYNCLIVLSQFLSIESKALGKVLAVVFERLSSIGVEEKFELFIEQLVKSCLFFFIRVSYDYKQKLVDSLNAFIEKVKGTNNNDVIAVKHIMLFTENVVNYLVSHQDDPQMILDSVTVDNLHNEFYLILPKKVGLSSENRLTNLFLLNIIGNCNKNLEYSDNLAISAADIRKFYYNSILHTNNELTFISVISQHRYRESQPLCITGYADVMRVSYIYRLDLETKHCEVSVKIYNGTSNMLENVQISIFHSEDISSESASKTMLDNLPPFSCVDLSFSYHFEKFNLNVSSLEASYNCNKERFKLETAPVKVPFLEFFIPDKFSEYETKMFDIFYNSLAFAFTVKGFFNGFPHDLMETVHDSFCFIELKFKDTRVNKYSKVQQENQSLDLTSKRTFNHEDAGKFNFQAKISGYCIFNFWVYVMIYGDFNEGNNKSVVNIQLKSNNSEALKLIEENKVEFLGSLFRGKLMFYS